MAKKGSFRLGRWIILVIAIVIGLVLSLLNYYVFNPANEYASTSIEFLYDGAAEGLAPNGQLFSIEGIRDEKLLSEAIKKCSLGDKITVAELSENMVVRGSFPSNIIDQLTSTKSLFASDPTRTVDIETYYPTVYRIAIYNDFQNGLSSKQLKALLDEIVLEYKQQYVAQYSSGIDWSTMNSIWNPSAYDYSQAITTLALRLDMVKTYAKELYDNEPTFVMENGTSFSTIVLTADTIATNDLQSLSANITINALSKDVDRLRSQYNYEIEQLNYRLKALNSELENINALIDDYEMDSDIYYTSGDSIVTVEGKSKTTYEALVDKKTGVTNEISSILISIDDYQNKVNDLDNRVQAGYSAANSDRMAEEIKVAEEKINKLTSDFDAMIKAYNSEFVKTEDVSSKEAKYYGNKLVSGSFIKTVIKSEAPVCAVALVIIAFIGLVAELKESRRRRS